MGRVYSVDDQEPLPCGCPVWQARLLDGWGHDFSQDIRAEKACPAEGWLLVHVAPGRRRFVELAHTLRCSQHPDVPCL